MVRRNATLLLALYGVLALSLVIVSMVTAFLILGKLMPIRTTMRVPAVVAVTGNALKTIERNYSAPSKLIIPKLDINANIFPMGLTAAGDMESPATNRDIGWYKYGSRPGNQGSAVIDGHFGLNGEAVFGKLNQLVPGDVISIVDDRGDMVSFSVREIKEYDRESDAEEVFDKQDGAHLNLITCKGEWEAKQATFSKRLVVFSDRIEG